MNNKKKICMEFSKVVNNLWSWSLSDSRAKGQLISKGLFGILDSSKKATYYDTSGRLVFVRFLEESRIPKSPFDIN